MSIIWPITFTLAAASLLPIQAALNSAINRALHRPPLVVMVSLGGSLIFMLVVALLNARQSWLALARLGSVPWWAWPAGVCGAVFLLSQPIALPRIGAAAYTGLSVTAQVCMAMMLDHWGLLGVPQHSAAPLRILGALLMICGIALIARF
jgi:transporter family-2 protein